jgi:hypothetical protein
MPNSEYLATFLPRLGNHPLYLKVESNPRPKDLTLDTEDKRTLQKRLRSLAYTTVNEYEAPLTGADGFLRGIGSMSAYTNLQALEIEGWEEQRHYSSCLATPTPLDFLGELPSLSELRLICTQPMRTHFLFPVLKRLEIDRCVLDPEGIDSFFRGSPNLQSLTITNTRISRNHSQSRGRFVHQNLIELNLKSIDDVYIPGLLFYGRFPSLKRLQINSVIVKDDVPLADPHTWLFEALWNYRLERSFFDLVSRRDKFKILQFPSDWGVALTGYYSFDPLNILN